MVVISSSLLSLLVLLLVSSSRGNSLVNLSLVNPSLVNLSLLYPCLVYFLLSKFLWDPKLYLRIWQGSPAEYLNPDDAVGPGGGGVGDDDQLKPPQPPGPSLGPLRPPCKPTGCLLDVLGVKTVPVPLLLRVLLWILVSKSWTSTGWPATSPRCFCSVCLGW